MLIHFKAVVLGYHQMLPSFTGFRRNEAKRESQRSETTIREIENTGNEIKKQRAEIYSLGVFWGRHCFHVLSLSICSLPFFFVGDNLFSCRPTNVATR